MERIDEVIIMWDDRCECEGPLEQSGDSYTCKWCSKTFHKGEYTWQIQRFMSPSDIVARKPRPRFIRSHRVS